MDGSRPDRPVNQASRQNPLQRAPPKSKLPIRSAPVELTPLSRLARFKEIRDRNLAKASSAVNSKRTSVQRTSTNMLNVNNTNPNTNGVAHGTNGNEVHSGPPKPKSVKNTKALNGVEPLDSTPKSAEPSSQKAAPSPPNGAGTAEENASQNGAEGSTQVQPEEEGSSGVVVLEEEQVNTEGGSGSEAETEGENVPDSEGSSLDVVVDESSSSESLDLHMSVVGSNEEFQCLSDSGVDVPGPSGSNLEPVREPASVVEEPYVPDVIKRLNSGGHISSRPSLRNKRRQEDDAYSQGRKRHCDDSSSIASALSTSWQFFSPSSALKRVWNRQAEPKGPKPDDDSMIVNVSTVDPPKNQKWCRIM